MTKGDRSHHLQSNLTNPQVSLYQPAWRGSFSLVRIKEGRRPFLGPPALERVAVVGGRLGLEAELGVMGAQEGALEELRGARGEGLGEGADAVRVRRGEVDEVGDMGDNKEEVDKEGAVGDNEEEVEMDQ